MSRDHRDEGKEASPLAASAGASPTRSPDAPIVDAGYQARCDARVLQFLSAPLPLTPSEREAREAGGEGNGVHAAAERGVSGAATALPHGDTIQAAFGPHDISGVRAHVGGPAADACGAMGASAYATGNQVAFAGQPDLHTAAHEAAHVVQQRQGVQLYGGVGEVGDVHERQADAVADRVVAGQSAEDLLAGAAPAPGRHHAIQMRKEASTPGTAHLVDNLLAAIDAAARKGLNALESEDDLDTARLAARQLISRIDHLLSVTAAPDGGASVAGEAKDAAHALGRAAALAAALRSRDVPTADGVEQMLGRVEIELAPSAGWHWKVEAHGRKAGGGLTRREGAAIGVETLAVVRSRAEAVMHARDAGPINTTAAAITVDLRHASRELALAIQPGQASPYLDDVLRTGEVLARFEALAYQRGVGMSTSLESMRTAETALRNTVGLPSERVIFESALPTLDAIIDIVNSYAEVRDGLAYDLSQPAAHRTKVPARYQPLLEQWFQVTHGRVRNNDGTVTTTRGRVLAADIDRAVAATMPLINALHGEGNPDQVGPWLEQFYSKVDAFRARATSETVTDHINEKADKALAADGSAIDQLDEETQVKIASQQLISIARQGVSIAQRIASSEKDVAKAALESFKRDLSGVDLPPSLKVQLADAQALADVAQHIAGVANGVEAVLVLTDPDQRKRMLEKEFGIHPLAGATQVTKQALWLVQGGISSYKLLSAGLLVAKGQTSAATQLLSASGKTLGNLGVALNGLNVAHGLLLVVFGSGTARLDGAVEATWGTLGLVGKFVPRLSRFTGPLGAAIAITHLTVKGIGNLAVGALYGMIKLGLNMAYQDMQRTAQGVHGTAMRLAVALESGDALSGAELTQELAKQTDALRWNLRELELRGYIERTKKHGGNADPGTYRPLRERFKPLWDAPMGTDVELLTTAELFLATVVYCFEDAQQVLEEAVAASLQENG